MLFKLISHRNIHYLLQMLLVANGTDETSGKAGIKTQA